MSRRVAAFWLKEANGKSYMSGVLYDISGDVNVAIFKNERKEKENQPDYYMVRSEIQKNNKKDKTKKTDPPF